MIGDKIKNKRKEEGLTQEELAKMIGVSTPAISQYERGSRTPSLKLFLKLLDALNMSVSEALGKE